MPIQTTFSKARANLDRLWSDVIDNQEIVIINRRGSEDIALISATELTSLLETAHLLRSSKNAERILTAINRAIQRSVPPQSVDELRREVGIGQEG